MMMQAATGVAEPSAGSFKTAWEIGGPWAVVALVLLFMLAYAVRLYIAEVQARIADARAYGKAQEDINAILIPTVSRLAKRMQLLEGANADSDRPPAMVVRESLIELGEGASSKGPTK